MPVISDLYSSYNTAEGDSGKPPIILIHGAGGTHLYWPPEIRRMPGHPIYALDLPGHGKSPGRGMQTIDGYSEEVIRWMDQLQSRTHISRAIIGGHSMGGAIALQLALNYPTRVAGLILVGTGARLRVHPTILSDSSNPTTYNKAIHAVLEMAFGPDVNPRLVELAGKRMFEIRQSVFHDDMVACNAFDCIDSVGAIRKPTLVICGSEDRMTPLRYSQFLAGAIPEAKLKVIPGAGHMVMLQRPQEVADEMREFLASLS